MSKVALFALIPGSVFLIAGCGLTGSAQVTPTPTSTSPSPTRSTASSQASTTPSSASTPSSSSSVSTPSSSAITTPTSSVTSSGTSSNVSYASVTTQAMKDLSNGKTGLPLAYPSLLPPPPGPGFGYLTATTVGTATSWFVRLLDTTTPLGVNSPNISSHLSTAAPYVGSWGITLLGSALPVTTAPERASVLRNQNPLWSPSEAAIKATGSAKIQVGATGAALGATVYTYNNNPATDKIMWAEGDWTIEVLGSTTKNEAALANLVVNYLHTHYLPPHPGLIMVQMTSASRAVTRIDWIEGDQLLYVAARQPMPINPVDAASMVVHWTPYQ